MGRPDAPRRGLAALLRWRARGLRAALGRPRADPARLLPLLLHASFEHPGLAGEPPGVAGLRYRPRWSSLARDAGLPPPFRARRSRPLVEAVLAVPTAEGLDALAVVPPGLALEDLGLVQERVEGAAAALRASGAAVRLAVFDAGRLERDREAAHRAMAFGALLAGRLGAASWEALEGTAGELDARAAAALAAGAPLPIASVALTLMTALGAPSPLDAARALLAGGLTARALADGETFAVRWAGLVPGAGGRAAEALRLSRPDAEPRELDLFLESARALAVACTAAVRGARLGRLDRRSAARWCDAVGPGLPRVLLPALAARLDAAAGHRPLALDPRRAGRAYEVRLEDGTLLGRGANPVQARVRALALVAAADGARPPRARGGLAATLAALDPAWREVAARLTLARDRGTLLLLPEAGGGARPGPPMDLLNRGAERALEFEGALAVSFAPGRRASGRMLDPAAAVRVAMRRALAGAPLEVQAPRPAARPVAARLAGIAALLRDPAVPAPVAVEAGGEVLVPRGDRLRTYALRRFAARPRVLTPDPEAPDLSLTCGERPGSRGGGARIVACRASLVDASSAALLYEDGAGGHLREVLPLAELEGRLADARAIVRGASPSCALAVRLADGLELALRRAGPAAPRVGVAVRGALPWVEVEVGGERFGGPRGLPWATAAEALLARLRGGAELTVGVDAVSATAGGAPATPLLALHASGVARRRLRTHLERAARAYRRGVARRREA